MSGGHLLLGAVWNACACADGRLHIPPGWTEKGVHSSPHRQVSPRGQPRTERQSGADIDLEQQDVPQVLSAELKITVSPSIAYSGLQVEKNSFENQFPAQLCLKHLRCNGDGSKSMTSVEQRASRHFVYTLGYFLQEFLPQANEPGGGTVGRKGGVARRTFNLFGDFLCVFILDMGVMGTDALPVYGIISNISTIAQCRAHRAGPRRRRPSTPPTSAWKKGDIFGRR